MISSIAAKKDLGNPVHDAVAAHHDICCSVSLGETMHFEALPPSRRPSQQPENAPDFGQLRLLSWINGSGGAPLVKSTGYSNCATGRSLPLRYWMGISIVATPGCVALLHGDPLLPRRTVACDRRPTGRLIPFQLLETVGLQTSQRRKRGYTAAAVQVA